MFPLSNPHPVPVLGFLYRIYEGMRKIFGLRMEGKIFQEVGLIAESEIKPKCGLRCVIQKSG